MNRKIELSGHFFAELQRRGVPRVGITYLAISILVILLVPYGEPLLNLPAWTGNALIVFLLFGLPIAIYLDWKYERSPEGFVRSSSKQSWQNPYKASQRKPLTSKFIIAGMALIIIFMSVYPRYLTTSEAYKPARIELTVEDKSIAVLPFVNMSGDLNMEPFCDGMTDAVISRLTKISSPGRVIIPNIHVQVQRNG